MHPDDSVITKHNCILFFYTNFYYPDGPGGDYFVTGFLPSLNKAYTYVHTYPVSVIVCSCHFYSFQHPHTHVVLHLKPTE